MSVVWVAVEDDVSGSSYYCYDDCVGGHVIRNWAVMKLRCMEYELYVIGIVISNVLI